VSKASGCAAKPPRWAPRLSHRARTRSGLCIGNATHRHEKVRCYHRIIMWQNVMDHGKTYCWSLQRLLTWPGYGGGRSQLHFWCQVFTNHRSYIITRRRIWNGAEAKACRARRWRWGRRCALEFGHLVTWLCPAATVSVFAHTYTTTAGVCNAPTLASGDS